MNANRNPFWDDARFRGVRPFEKRVWLASPTMHGDERRWVDEAIKIYATII